MAQHLFLSPEWIAEARAIRDEFQGRSTSDVEPVKANVVVTDPPFGDGDIEGHVDTTAGAVTIDEWHLNDPEVTVTTDYETAYTLFVDRDPAKVMEAFMLGKFLITGDVAKVMGFAGAQPPTDPDEIAIAKEIASRLAAITAG